MSGRELAWRTTGAAVTAALLVDLAALVAGPIGDRARHNRPPVVTVARPAPLHRRTFQPQRRQGDGDVRHAGQAVHR